MEEICAQLESLLFASAKPLSTEELSKLVKEVDLNAVRQALKHLAEELDAKKSSLMLVEELDRWRFTIREKYLSFVKKVVKKTELPKSMLETLAVVAYKAPVLQSKVIKIRTNKAYKHLDELEQEGYIGREKKGRTKLIKLTQKFFDYFDIPPEKLKDRFKNVTAGQPVEVYDTLERVAEQLPSPTEVIREKVGELNVYETKPLPEEQKETLGNLEVFPIAPGQEHEHRKHYKKGEETVTAVIPEFSADKQGQAPQPVPEGEEKNEEKRIEQQVVEIRPEEFVPEVKQLITATQKEKVKGLYPEGIPEDVEEKAKEKVKAMLEPKKEEESQHSD